MDKVQHPFRIQFDDDDMAFIVIASSDDEAYDKWLVSRKEAGCLDMIEDAAKLAGTTVRDLTDVFALPVAGGEAFYADRI